VHSKTFFSPVISLISLASRTFRYNETLRESFSLLRLPDCLPHLGVYRNKEKNAAYPFNENDKLAKPSINRLYLPASWELQADAFNRLQDNLLFSPLPVPQLLPFISLTPLSLPLISSTVLSFASSLLLSQCVYFYAALLRHLVAARSVRDRGEKKPFSTHPATSASARIIAVSLVSVIGGAISSWRQVHLAFINR